MICENCLERFVRALADSEDTDIAAQRAFEEIAEKYHIRRVVMQFVVRNSLYTRGGDMQQRVLFDTAGETEGLTVHNREFTTGEGGTVSFYLYCAQGQTGFSAEEERELDIIMNILFFHSGRWRLINHVRRLSLTDALTDMPNSGGFLTYVDKLLERKELARYNAYYFNLTRFSLVNKRFGSRETDTVIVRYTKELQKFLKEDECVGRLGGDNFVALVLKERTDEFLKLLSGVETYAMLGNQRIPLVISAVAGVFEIDESVVSCDAVIGECAIALNIAKHIEKKPYLFASEEIRRRVEKEKQVASGFMEALHKGEFKAFYQPKVNTETYRIVGAEALARWEHEGKLIPPIEFVPILEQNGMICMLDFYVLEQVCKDIKDWMQKGIDPVRVSVNLSRRHLANPNLAEDIMNILDKYKTESRYIELELTETVDEAESAQLVDFMEKMKNKKVALSIDDFGTGYSSLNMLRSFPVDVLKLDRTFLNSLEENDRIVLSNIIRMASELKMDVVAEGVENWQQVDYLKKMACKVVQGFLFDKPMPRQAFEEKLKIGKYEIDSL